MNHWIRKILVALAGIAGIVAVGLGYHYLVEPQQAVWDEDNPVHWERDKIPLKVSSSVYVDALEDAVGFWNDQAACPLFRIDGLSPTITIRQGTIEVGAESEDWAAHAEATKVGGKAVRGEIAIHVPLMVGTDLQVIHHELGHILGLAHDRSYTMLPIKKEEIGGRQKLVRAQDKDIKALNERYCSDPED